MDTKLETLKRRVTENETIYNLAKDNLTKREAELRNSKKDLYLYENNLVLLAEYMYEGKTVILLDIAFGVNDVGLILRYEDATDMFAVVNWQGVVTSPESGSGVIV